FVLGGLAVYFIRDGNLKWSVAPMIVGVAAIVLSTSRLRLSTPATPPPDIITPPVGPQQLNLRLEQIEAPPPQPKSRMKGRVNESSLGTAGLLVSAFLLWVSLRQFGLEEAESRTLAWFAYGASMIALLVALPTIDGRWTAGWLAISRRDGIHISLDALTPWLLLAGILTLGAGLRFYNLDNLPAGLWFDEADNLFQAREIVRDPGNMKVYVPSTNLPSMFLMPIAVLVKLAGVAITTGRLVSVLFGLLGIVTVFVFVRFILGTWPALIAAFLVTVMRWDINWSRIGMHGITAPLFAALTAYLTLRALRSGRLSDYGFAGASLGLSMWFYTSLRMFPLVVGFLLLHHLIFKRPAIKGFVGRVSVMILISLAMASPVIQFAIDDSELFFARTDTTSVFTLVPRDRVADTLQESLVQHALMFHEKGDPNPRHNIPGAPMLDYLTGTLMILGMGIALWRWRDIALISLPFWVFFMTLPGVLTVPWEAPQSLRAISVIPAVAAMCALAIAVMWRAGRNAPWASVRRGATPFVLALLGIIAYLNIDTYFGEQANNPEVFASFSTDETLMSRHMTEQQRRGYSIWVSRQFLFGLTSTLLASHPRFEIIKAPETIPLDPSVVWRGASIYLEPREPGFFQTLKAYYPDGQFTEVRAPGGGEPLYYSAVVSAEQLAARQGLEATYVPVGGPTIDQTVVTTQAVWHADLGPAQFPYQLIWEGSLHIVHPGEYTLKLDGDINATVEMDGRRILDQENPEIRLVPAVGLHSISIHGNVDETNTFIRLLWQPPNGELEPVPVNNLYHGSVRPIGLAGRFFSGEEPDDSPDGLHITPATDNFYYTPVVEEPYIGVWEGTVKVETPSVHQFRVEGAGNVRLYVDGDLVASRPPSDGVEEKGEIGLQAGEVPIRVTYFSPSPPSEFKALWAPLGRPFEPIPQELMTPSKEHMFRILE
ncbi:MAG: glycosyltransferase family 39 protein, partial [SAR202 cluster bacterium]|nr:glycosyltransferase family 39 protein [SAR202 cluster bacterium]